MPKNFNTWVLNILQCPVSGTNLRLEDNGLQSEAEEHIYLIDMDGVVQFSEIASSSESRAQQEHYDQVAASYIKNLSFPHTIEYLAYLDSVFEELIDGRCRGDVLELCCGAGEAGKLLGGQYQHLLGLDISYTMVRAARRNFPEPNVSFHQGDATELPIKDATMNSVIIFGGIHHVPDRQKLFSEIARVLKPGGGLYFREPCDDFFLWRWMRVVIYRIAPALDHETEAPLRQRETIDELRAAGFSEIKWKTFGFIGFCLFMNSDVLWFNGLFRYLPLIRPITRFFIAVDHFLAATRIFSNAGTIAIGAAIKRR
jgi:ubiquinone/menaquinone biosynthesis C-methylase UbiE